MQKCVENGGQRVNTGSGMNSDCKKKMVLKLVQKIFNSEDDDGGDDDDDEGDDEGDGVDDDDDDGPGWIAKALM